MAAVDLFPRTSSVFTDYCTLEGQVIYRVEASSRWNGKIVTIRKVVSGTSNGEGNPALKDGFEEIGRLELSRFSEATICLPEKKDDQMTVGPATKVSDIFKRRGWPKIEALVFNGPDGKSYEWTIGPFQVKLYPVEEEGSGDNPGPTIPVAEFPHLVSTSGERASSLDTAADRTGRKKDVMSLRIVAHGHHLVDCIFVSFVYAEAMRRKQEPKLTGVKRQSWLVPLR